MKNNIILVGRTNEREVYVASPNRPFVLNEYLIIQDAHHDNPIGEIVESFSCPSINESTFPEETGIFASMERMKMFKDVTPSIYIAKMKLLEEWQTPIAPESKVLIPDYDEIEHLLMKASPERGFTLGVIRGTEPLQTSLPSHLSQISPLLSGENVMQQNGVPFILDYYSFREYPHIGMFGGSGSGKTFGLRVICEEIMTKGIPGIVLDPHYEMNFNHSMKNLPEGFEQKFDKKHEIFQIGVNVGINFTDLSPDELISLMEFVADLSQPMRGAIEQLHQKNDSFTTLFTRINMLKKAVENMEKPIREREKLTDDIVMLYQQHKDSIAGSATLQAVSWRLDQLDKTGIFEHDISLVEACMLKRKLAVIRGKQSHLKMIASYMIGKLYRKRRVYKDWEQKSGDTNVYPPQKFPPFFVIMDEAHNFAPNTPQANPTKRILREIAQEARKYGVFEVFGTQRPALLDTTITAQLNTKIIFRTGIESDMQMIKTETNLNPQEVAKLPELSSGNAYVSSATLRKTMYIQFRVTKTVSPHASHPFDELDSFNSNDKLKKVLLTYLPLSNSTMPSVHSKINHDMGKMIPIKEINEVLEEMCEEKEIRKETSPFGSRYIL